MSLTSFATRYHLPINIDTDGTEIIRGTKGHIYEYDETHLGVMVCPRRGDKPEETRAWPQHRFLFKKESMHIHQNGDFEGAALFEAGRNRQVRLALRAAGIRRRANLSPTQIAVLTAHQIKPKTSREQAGGMPPKTLPSGTSQEVAP
jgi:hypothetical protein